MPRKAANAQVAELREKYAILKSLSDDEIGKLAMAEKDRPLPEGEEYIDLEHLDRGVQRVGHSRIVSSATAVARSAVYPGTWVKLVRELPRTGKPG